MYAYHKWAADAYQNIFILQEVKVKFMGLLSIEVTKVTGNAFFASERALTANLFEEGKADLIWKISPLCVEKEFMVQFLKVAETSVRRKLNFMLRKCKKETSLRETFRNALIVWENCYRIIRYESQENENMEDLEASLKIAFTELDELWDAKDDMTQWLAEHCNKLLTICGNERKCSRAHDYKNFLVRCLSQLNFKTVMCLSSYTGGYLQIVFFKDTQKICVANWYENPIDYVEWTNMHNLRNGQRGNRSICMQSRPRCIRSAHWPEMPGAYLKLPKELQAVSNHAELFYRAQGEHHEFSFVPTAGRCIITTRFFGDGSVGPIRISLTTGQMCVLALFEEVASRTVEDIGLELMVQNDEERVRSGADLSPEARSVLYAILRSLMTDKYLLLRKSPEVSTLRGSDVVGLNRGYIPGLEPQEINFVLSPKFCSQMEGEN